MRVLTVRQPWAWAIVRGLKTVENRTRNLAGGYTGPLAIHAAVAPDERLRRRGDVLDVAGYEFTRDAGGVLARSDALAWPYRMDEWTGHIIGVVHLAGVHHSDREDANPCGEWREEMGGMVRRRVAMCSPWAEPGAWHLELADAMRTLHPIAFKGSLGMRTLPDEVAARVREELVS